MVLTVVLNLEVHRSDLGSCHLSGDCDMRPGLRITCREQQGLRGESPNPMQEQQAGGCGTCSLLREEAGATPVCPASCYAMPPFWKELVPLLKHSCFCQSRQ